MAACTQAELDAVVERCKEVVAKYGGQSDELREVRKYYTMLEACAEHGALVALESALDDVENEVSPQSNSDSSD